MDIKEILKFDFKKIDLKSIDIQTLKDLFATKKKLIVQGVIILIFGVALIGIIVYFQTQYQQAKSDAKVLEEKKKAIEQYEKSLKDVAVLKESISQEIDEDQLSNQIADYAAQNNVLIFSFSANKKLSDSFSESTSMRIFVTVKTYKDFLMFLQSIESSKYSFRVDSCILTLNNNLSRADQQGQDLSLHADLNVVYTKLKK